MSYGTLYLYLYNGRGLNLRHVQLLDGKRTVNTINHRVPVSARPVKTLRRLLVHRKNKQEKKVTYSRSFYHFRSVRSGGRLLAVIRRAFSHRQLKSHKVCIKFCAATLKRLTQVKPRGSFGQDSKTQDRKQWRINHSQEISIYPVRQNRTSQLWLTIQAMTTIKSTGRNLQSRVQSLIEKTDGLRKQCTSKWRVGVLWTEMRAATHWASHASNFLPYHITTMARTGRRIVKNSSDEGLW